MSPSAAAAPADPGPPYRRIAAELRARIDSGEWAPGDRVPSTRQITRDWGVAMATATKVLAVLRTEGLIETVRGVGTVVARRPATSRRRPAAVAGSADRAGQPRAEPPAGREQLAAAAVAIADAEGVAAVTMRRLAADVGVATMSLYRYVDGKDALVQLMIDAVFGEVELPQQGPRGWRARLELLTRLQWRICRRHPWLPPLVSSVARPPLAPNAMAHTEWAMRALDGLGLDTKTRLALTMTSSGYVIGMAMRWSVEVDAEQETGMTSDQWFAANDATAAAIFASGRYPQLAAIGSADMMDLDALFEFGLRCHLDGIAALVERHR